MLLETEEVETPARTTLTLELWQKSPTLYQVCLGNTVVVEEATETQARESFRDAVRWAAGLHTVHAD